jgi:hypothetical protein
MAEFFKLSIADRLDALNAAANTSRLAMFVPRAAAPPMQVGAV